MGPLWGRGVIWQLWGGGDYGAAMRRLWGIYGVTIGSLRVRYGVRYGVPMGVTMGSL